MKKSKKWRRKKVKVKSEDECRKLTMRNLVWMNYWGKNLDETIVDANVEHILDKRKVLNEKFDKKSDENRSER